MFETEMSVWKSIFHKLEQAAITPQRRNEFLYSALKQFVIKTRVSGTAFVWSDEAHDPPWNYLYVGTYEAEMRRWLSRRISVSSQEIISHLEDRPPSFLDLEPHVYPILASDSVSGILVVWVQQVQQHTFAMNNEYKTLLAYLEALLKMEHNHFYKSNNPLDPEFVEAIQHKDQSGLSALLSLTRFIGEADLVYWGDIYQKHIDITFHLGAIHPEFGFQLPVGKGLGGKAALTKNVLHVNDYRNSEYRYPDVSKAVDQEGIRSGIAIPIKGKNTETNGVLYATRRNIKPFSLAQRLSLLRLIRSIEPVSGRLSSSRFYIGNSDTKFIRQKKSELRKLLQNSKQISDIESWLGSLIKGSVMAVDSQGIPYSQRNINKDLQNNVQKFPLDASNGLENGFLYLWPSVELPLKGWPDLIEDVISSCQVILERQDRIFSLSRYQRSQWMNHLMNGSSYSNQYYDGIRLGLPVDRGQIWMIAWQLNEKNVQQRIYNRLEESALKLTKCPLIFLKDKAVLLIDEQRETDTPENLRDELLKSLPVPTWVVHGAVYHSFPELKNALELSFNILDRVRKSNHEAYVVNVNGYGLDSLLNKQNISRELETFANKTLEPIIKYDAKNNTQFTKTLALALTLESPDEVAKRLFVHTNTVHYRVSRAKDLLLIDLNSPGNKIALQLAAYIWLRQQHHNLLNLNSCDTQNI